MRAAHENSPQFVAVEVGFWHYPQTLMLAALLNEDPMMAGARICKLREYVLVAGGYDGALKASPEEIAMVCGWRKLARSFVAALVKVRILKGRRLTWQYVDWQRTRTGHYQAKRADDAQRQRENRAISTAARRAAAGIRQPTGGAPGENQDHPSVDGSRMSTDSLLERKKERKDGPPEPPKGGECVWEKDWEWFEKTYPNPRNPEESQKLFAALTQEDRDRIRIHLPRVVLKKPSRWQASMDKYLKQKTFRSIKDPYAAEKPEKTEKPIEETPEYAVRREAERAIMERVLVLKRELKAKGMSGEELIATVDRTIAAEAKRGAFGSQEAGN